MARVTGKDVLVDLMSTVKALTESQTRQDEDIQRIIVRLELMNEHTNALVRRVDGLAAQMEQMAVQMNAMTTQMNAMTTQMNAMSAGMGVFARELGAVGEDQNSLRGDFVTLARHGLETRTQLNRLSGILTRLSTSTDNRLEDVEARLAKLEKKTG